MMSQARVKWETNAARKVIHKTMSSPPVYVIDLEFQGRLGAIAAYLIPHRDGVALVECGPGATLPALQKALAAHGYTVASVTDVFLTHIHFDHAGAAGWLAQQGAHIHVHPNGAPHLLNPEKLIASATRIYGDRMHDLWGDFLPVPEARLSTPQDGAEMAIGGLHVTVLDTPGHANHHYCYLIDGVCFTGDVGGVRMGARYLRLPAPPPEFHIEKWRASLERLRQAAPTHLALTHFGLYDDPDWHLSAAAQALDELEAWMTAVMPSDPPVEALYEQFAAWNRTSFFAAGLDAEWLAVYEVGSPTTMSADGIRRYWQKFRV
jgi:glyoxylase-like metal-dependent hydrolase (beta-lactamase superfamily II)